MKKKLLTIIIALFNGCAYAQSWIQQDVPLGFEGYIFDMETVNANVAWGVPYDNSTGTPTPTSNFVRTTDGGAMWTMATVAGSATAELLSNIWPIDSQTCYAAMYNSGGPGGAVYKTIDGGVSWTNVDTSMFSGTTSFADFVWFNDAMNGVAVGDPVGVPTFYETYYTNDGGATWNVVYPPDIPYSTSSTEYGVVNLFTSAQGHLWFGTSEGDIYHSSDMGHTWEKYATGFPPYTSSTGGRYDISDIAFADSLNGIALQVNSTGYLVKRTSDGGDTWVDFIPSGNLYISDIDAVPGSDLLISAGSSNAGGFGTSFSLDYGLSWTNIDSLVSHTSIDFSDNMSGYSGEYIPAGAPGGVWKYDGTPLSVITQFAQTKQTHIYPNPSDGIVNVIGESGSGKTTFEIYDLHEALIYSKTLTSMHIFNHTFNFSNLPAGMYIMKIKDENNTTAQKLLIQ